MIKTLAIGAVMFIGHVGLFTLTYYGRRRGVWLCQSDLFLFCVPFLVAVVAYAALFSGMFATTERWKRIALASFAALWIAAGSAVVGMSVAFTLMGT